MGSAAQPKPRGILLDPVLWLGGLAILFITYIVGGSDIFVLMFVGGAVFICLTPLAPWLGLMYFGFILTFCFWVNRAPIDVIVAKVYFTDFIIVLMGWAAIIIAAESRKAGYLRSLFNRPERILLIILGAYLAYGCFGLVYGLFAKGYEYDEAFGDFRRFYFYAAALSLPLLLPYKTKHLDYVGRTVLISCTVLLGIALFRIATGTSVREDIDNATGHVGVRLLVPDEITTLSLLLAYLVLVLRGGSGIAPRVFALIGIFAVIPPLLMSGYRLSVFLVFAAAILAVLIYAWANRSSIVRAFAPLVATGLLMIPGVALTPFLFPEQFARMRLDLLVRMQTDVTQGGWRRWTWGQAVTEWLQEPILGTGLGHRLIFPFRTSDGAFLYIDSSVHNLFLEVLYQGGVIGLILFLSVHGYSLWIVLSKIRFVDKKYLLLLSALFAAYLANMLGCALQSPGISRYVYTYILMGFMLLIVRETVEQPNSEPSASAATAT